jgi:hypothetical protein
MDVGVKMGQVDWIYLAKVRDSWRALAKEVINLSVP